MGFYTHLVIQTFVVVVSQSGFVIAGKAFMYANQKEEAT